MQIILKLFASLSEHLPPGPDEHARLGNQVAVDVPEATAVQAVIDSFHLPHALVHLVLVNGWAHHPREALGPRSPRGACARHLASGRRGLTAP